jgi:Flp pilus assembly protein CpaB
MPERRRPFDLQLPRLTRIAPWARQLMWALRRSRTARRALLIRLAAGATVATTLWMLRHDLDSASELRHQWGPTRRVVVTTAEVHLGESIDESNTELVERPVRHIPDGSLRELPARRRAAIDMPPGSIVTKSQVSRSSSVATGVPSGRTAVTFAVQSPAPMVGPGDHVEVLAPASDELTSGAGGSGAARRVSTDAVVLTSPKPTDGDLATLTVTVRQADVAEVAGAALAGPLALVVPSEEP